MDGDSMVDAGFVMVITPRVFIKKGLSAFPSLILLYRPIEIDAIR